MLSLSGLFLLASLGAADAGTGQVLVVGNHHSGTSLLSRSLHLLGFNLGEPGDILKQPGKPMKFWEHKDVVRLNEARMSQDTSSSLPSWIGQGFDPSVGTPLTKSAAVQALVKELNQNQPWSIKDPRLSLVASEWLQLMEEHAICIMPVRPSPLHSTPCLD